jgi:hypothetical protein
MVRDSFTDPFRRLASLIRSLRTSRRPRTSCRRRKQRSALNAETRWVRRRSLRSLSRIIAFRSAPTR